MNKFLLQIAVFGSLTLLALSSQAAGTINCHDRFLSSASTITLDATIVDALTLSDVTITPGAWLPEVKTLKTGSLALHGYRNAGFELVGSNAPATDFVADVIPGKTYSTEYAVLLKMGSKWFEDRAVGRFIAELQFYPNEAGGTSPFQYNLYCEAR